MKLLHIKTCMTEPWLCLKGNSSAYKHILQKKKMRVKIYLTKLKKKKERERKEKVNKEQKLFIYLIFFSVFLPFVGPLPWHMEIPRLGV